MIVFNAGFLKAGLQSIKDKNWYHQRFDGCPAFILLIDIAETRKELRKMDGGENYSHVCWFKNGTADWLIGTRTKSPMPFTRPWYLLVPTKIWPKDFLTELSLFLMQK